MNISDPMGVSPREEAYALAEQYKKILKDMFFGGIVPVTLPWQDSRFRDMFAHELRRLRRLEDDAKKWSSIKELTEVLGKAMRT